MKLTKYAHACFTVEKDHQTLVVDPGNVSTDYLPNQTVVGIVLTHEHADHYDNEILASIIDKNPEALIIAHPDVTATIEAFRSQAVEAGDTLKVGAFTLSFFGGVHAIIHRSAPPVANLGVMINDLLYYPGDSFVLPGQPVDTLAVPIGGPWVKIGDAMDFLDLVSPRFAFPTHDAVLSEVGKEFADNWMSSIAEKKGVTYQRLEDPIEL